jgi:glycine/D-amino acid oxidase-like deaminating enzyme
VRVCVAGGGLAGSLLGWRLAQLRGTFVDLMVGQAGSPPCGDATAASGGAVRAYDRLPEQRELAVASLAELLASPVLRRWSCYRQTGFAYLRADGADLAADLAEIERQLPGSADLTSPAEAFGAQDGGRGWAGDEATVVVRERLAGCTSPASLRAAALADLAARPRASVRGSLLAGLTADVMNGYDAVVLATGAWTPGLLRGSGLPADGYRTRSIQYTTYEAGAARPPAFCDDRTGLYGLPTADGGMLLGLPTTEWDGPAGHGRVTQALHDQALHDQALRLAAGCLPWLKLGDARRRVAAADCYCDRPVLTLRRVAGPGGTVPGLFTFTGGSGGAAKTALAASQRAALELTGEGGWTG